MRGTVLSYNGTTGLISGDDGRRYSFHRNDVAAGTTFLPAGSTVDFELDTNGRATAVYLIAVATNLSERNKWIASILCFFLGPLGIHKFYMGKTNAGVIMLIGSIILVGLPLTMLISFIELIIYLVKSEQSFYEDYVVGNKSWF